MDTTNPVATDAHAGGTDVATGTAPATTEAVGLETLSKITGREYKSVSEVEQHLKNLNALVGDQSVAETRKAADEYTKLAKAYAEREGVSVSEARKALADLVEGESDTKKSDDAPSDRALRREMNQIKADLARRDFLESHAEAKPFIDAIIAGAKGSGQTLEEFYESSRIKDAIGAYAKSSTSSAPLNSKPRVTKGGQKLHDIGAEVRKNPTEAGKKALVEETLRAMGQL